jgi:hypothetical protein
MSVIVAPNGACGWSIIVIWFSFRLVVCLALIYMHSFAVLSMNRTMLEHVIARIWAIN